MIKPHGLYTIPSGHDFLKKLAEGLMMIGDGSPDSLTRMRVLLPTRRAVRGLRDAFLEIHGKKTVLLPRLQPIGDIDADELDLTLSGLGLDIADIPPSIRPLERQFLLAKMIRAKDPGLTTEQSLSLARNLATLMDQVHTEGLDFSALSNLVDSPDLADHWKETLEFLDIITTLWPKILEERAQIDPSHRRALLMQNLTNLWQHTPPKEPVIAAGSTGSIPTTAALLKTIATMPNGSVILPGLDMDLEQQSWDHIDDTHPQRTMKNFLKMMGCDRSSVQIWPSCCTEETKKAYIPRRSLTRSIMRPTSTFGRDILDKETLEDFNKNITICETSDAREHAAVIATALRIILQEQGKTACFITPDRPLARRVTTALKRWNIEADDSAGQSLSTTLSGIMILTLLRTIEEKFSPIPFLELLKHPLSQYRQNDQINMAQFECLILRGNKPAAGWTGLRARFNSLKEQDQFDLSATVTLLDHDFSPLEKFYDHAHSPREILETILETIEFITGQSDLFWTRPESNALSSFFTELIAHSHTLPAMTFTECAAMLRELLAQETFREIESRHPRIVILGQLESRLIRHDVMILSGLNEGMWPSEPAHDPFMSRPMRTKFGLPPAGRSIGLSAHDFTEAMAAPHVIITRAIKENGTETVPARWLQRLTTLLIAAGQKPDWTRNHLIDWTRQLDEANETFKQPTAPEPRPPLDTRPQRLSATRIEKWMNNPYHIYAQKILHLYRIDSLEDSSIHAERGNFVHKILEDFIKQTKQTLPENSKDIFLSIARAQIEKLESLSPQWHYWWPRMDSIADWVIDQEKKWRKHAIPWKQEIEGQYKIYDNPSKGRSFTITAKADRIDRTHLGSSAAIIDYKTGNTPSLWRINTGLSPQLPIEALILAKGGFASTPLDTSILAYWKVDGNGAEIRLDKKTSIDLDALVKNAEEGLINLIKQFEDPTTPYTAFAPQGRLYEDERAYAHLARTGEWSVMNANDDDDDSSSQEGAA